MYNKIVDTLKGIARDALRMKMIVKLQTALASVVSDINQNGESVMAYKKQIARNSFKVSQINEADPDKEDKLKGLAEDLEYIEQGLTNLEKDLENLSKDKAEVEAKIAKVEAGEIKVDLDALNTLTNELILEITKSTAVETAARVTAPTQ